MKEQHKIGNPQSGIWKKTLIIAFWLLVWQIVCWLVDRPIFFAGPLEVAKELAHMAGSRDFAASIINSLLRIIGGFAFAFLLACLLAAAAYGSKLLEDVLEPFVTFIKSVPVASVVVLLLIWFGAKYLSVYVTFMVVFPNIYLNLLNGLKNTDKNLLEMAEVFRFSFFQKLLYVYRPAVLPYLLGGAAVSVGMSFKSGVAAEVIGLPVSSIGERLYYDKIYLNTAGVFAWTVVIILLSALTERLIAGLLKRFGEWDFGILKCFGQRKRGGLGKFKQRECGFLEQSGQWNRGKLKCCEQRFHGIFKRKRRRDEKIGEAADPACRKKSPMIVKDLTVPLSEKKAAIMLKDVTVSFGEKKVLNGLDARFEAGGTYCVMGPSGCGKTTLLRVCAGLQKPAGGRVYYGVSQQEDGCGEGRWKQTARQRSRFRRESVSIKKTGMAFQEDRLCMQLTALDNVLLTADRKYSVEQVVSLLSEIFPQEALRQTAEQLSGGMKRRIAVARAVLSDAECLLLDEPFAGLDEANHERLLCWILQNRNGRLLIVTTHEETDAKNMDAEVLRIG